MNTKIEELFHDVELATWFAKCIAWDGCHKIYLAMDETEEKFFVDYYQPHVVYGDPKTLMQTIREWWDASCSLRFISAVSHNEEDPNAGFVSLISQFADEDDWDEEEDED
jgi:hypothetical protein